MIGEDKVIIYKYSFTVVQPENKNWDGVYKVYENGILREIPKSCNGIIQFYSLNKLTKEDILNRFKGTDGLCDIKGDFYNPKIEETLKDITSINNQEIHIYAGRRAMYDFDVEMVIKTLDHKRLEDRYRKLAYKQYYLELKLERLRNNKFMRLLKFFKIINI